MNLITHQQLTALVDQHSASLVLFARQWCNDPDDAVQQAFIELVQLEALPRDQVAWLYTTTKRRAINQTRGESRHRKRNQVACVNVHPPTDGNDPTPWFESNMEKNEEVAKLKTKLETLEPVEREIIVARIWGELSFEQIGSLVGRSSSSVHRDYQTALVKLRQAWTDTNSHTICINSNTKSAAKQKSVENDSADTTCQTSITKVER